LTCMLTCIRAWAGSMRLPSPACSHPTYSRTGRSAALVCSQLPMILTEEAMVHIRGSIEVSMALVGARGAEKELAPTAIDPLPCLIREPHAEAATTRTILRGTMGIDFHTHHSSGIRFFFRELIDFAFQLVGLFAIEPPRFASP
jgi:hypothetical protein